MEKANDIKVLKSFLEVPLENPNPIFSCFLKLPNREIVFRGTRPERFLYVRGQRTDKVLLVAHADTDEFRDYVRRMTNYTEPDRFSYTDIVTLCKKIAGVNLSVGYYNEHSYREKLSIDEWQNTLNICRRWLSEKDLPRFSLN